MHVSIIISIFVIIFVQLISAKEFLQFPSEPYYLDIIKTGQAQYDVSILKYFMLSL